MTEPTALWAALVQWQPATAAALADHLRGLPTDWLLRELNVGRLDAALALPPGAQGEQYPDRRPEIAPFDEIAALDDCPACRESEGTCRYHEGYAAGHHELGQAQRDAVRARPGIGLREFMLWQSDVAEAADRGETPPELPDAPAASPDEQLRAERDGLLAELGGRDDEARERWIQKQLDETGIRAMDFRNGAEMELEPARELLAHWVAAARTMLGDAPNYTETRLSMDVKVAESPELYTLVVQRHGPGVLTPHEARQRAEGALAEVLGIVSAWCVEANEVGGVDAGDLAWRLEQAGYPLPDEETAGAAEGSDH